MSLVALWWLLQCPGFKILAFPVILVLGRSQKSHSRDTNIWTEVAGINCEGFLKTARMLAKRVACEGKDLEGD